MTRKTWINRTVFAAAGVALLATALPLAAQQAGPRGPGAGDREERIDMFFATFDADADGAVTEAEIESMSRRDRRVMSRSGSSVTRRFPGPRSPGG